MWEPAKNYGYVLLIAVVCFFCNLGSAALFEEDEPKNAECGREMFVRGDWLVPTFNEELRTDKPILLYWLMLTAFHLLGMHELAARVPSALLSTGTIMLVFLLANRLFKHRPGVLAALILATSIMFTIIARASTPDGTLIFLITLTLTIYVLNLPIVKQNRSTLQWPSDVVPDKLQTSCWLGVCMGLAVLAKGPVGILLPCLIMGFTVVMARYCFTLNKDYGSWKARCVSLIQEILHPRILWQAMWSLRPQIMIPVALCVALPWYIAVTIQTDGAWLAGFLGKHNVGRFLTPMEKHGGPFFYYIPVICIGFFPWSMFLLMSLYHGIKQVVSTLETQNVQAETSTRENQVSREQFGHLFLLCWLGLYVVFFSCAQTKLPNYVLPVYPALALLTASFLARWQNHEIELRDFWMKFATYAYGMIGVLLSFGLYFGFKVYFPHQHHFAEIGIVVTCFSLGLIWWLNQHQRLMYVQVLCGFSLTFSICLFSYVAPALSRMQDGVILGEFVSQQYQQPIELGTFEYFSPNLPFYAERKVHRFHDAAQLDAYLNDPDHLLIIKAEAWDKLKTNTNIELRVIEKVPRFLRRHELYLIGKTTGQSTIAVNPDNLSRE